MTPEPTVTLPQPRRRRRVLGPLAATLIMLSVAVPAGANSLAEEEGCPEPVATRTHTAETMTLTLEVGLRDCDWWDGSPLELVGFIGRDDGSDTQEGNFALGLTACSAVENEGYEDGTEARFDKVGCAIEVVVEHDASEVAYYYGGISYLWEDGPREISLDTTCVSSVAVAVCRDEFGPGVRGPGIRT